MRESRYAQANEATDIVMVCRLIGMDAGYAASASAKTYCPFGDVSHLDGGRDRAFRIYPETNTAYCFACGEHYTPVKLWAVANDIDYSEAADYLLELAGVTEANTEERWNYLRAPEPVTVSVSDLAEALKVFCARTIPRWEERQLDPDAASLFQRCLDLLPSVRSQKDAEEWLTTTKKVMVTKLGEDRGVRQVG